VLLDNFLYFSERGSAERARGCRAGARTDRNLADAHLALARFLYTIDWNVDTAKLEVNQALELNPRNAHALRLASELASTRGQTDRALDFASKAIVNDPLGSRGFTRIAAAEIGKGNLVWGSSRTSQSARVKLDGGSGALFSRVGAGS
jgi:tetratricopeptide (TPR) repeat protein